MPVQDASDLSHTEIGDRFDIVKESRYLSIIMTIIIKYKWDIESGR